MCSNKKKKRRETNPTGRIHQSAVRNVKSVASVSVRVVLSHSKQMEGKQSKETAEVGTIPPSPHHHEERTGAQVSESRGTELEGEKKIEKGK